MKHWLVFMVLFFSQLLLAQSTNSDLIQLQNHPQKDTTRCFLLNKIIEAENNNSIWIKYNNELQKIAQENLKKEKNKTLKNTYLKYLSISFNNEGAFQLYNDQYEKAISLYRKSLQIANSIQYYYGSALALQNIGTAFDYAGKIDSTLVYMKKAYHYAVLSKNKTSLAYVLTDLGYIYNNLGNNHLAIKYNLQALPLFEKLNDLEGLERTNFALGRIFDNQNDWKTSTNYYLKCLTIDRKNNNKERLILILNSLATANIHLNQFNKALDFNNEAFQLSSQMNNEDLLATSYKNYGDIYFEKKEIDKAKSYYLKAEAIYKKIKSNLHLSKVQIKLASILFKQNQLKKAKAYGLNAYELAQKTNFPSDQKNAAEILSQIFFKENDFKNAYKYQSIASDISEKIYFDESKDIALKATYQYETEKKEAAIKALHQKNRIAELESKKKTTTLYLVILFFTGIATTSYVLFSRFKEKKKNEILQNQLAETEKLLAAEKKVTESELKALKSQMNPHFIFNALNSIQMQFMYGDKLTANEQLNNFTYLTRQILEVSGKKSISISDEVEILTKYLELEQLRFQKDFTYSITVSENIDEDYHKIPPMLIQPIVENSIKHGLLHQKGDKNVSVHFDIDQHETHLICTVTDNGIGRQKSAEIKAKNHSIHNSFSTQAIEQRLELLNEKLQLSDLVTYSDLVSSENEINGTKVVLKIPIV
ncbi:MAG: tetratricopeptide repeat protein [Flavobacterium sp.]|nr:tetratricopeptide repeat protein [Flavobacterium sp.]